MASPRWKIVKKEFFEHLPSTMLGVLLGIGLLQAISGALVNQHHHDVPEVFEKIFHIFHGGHLFLSAITATAICLRHKKHPVKTAVVVFIVTLIFCGLSDALIPFIGGKLSGSEMHFHLCIIEDTWLVILSNLGGILAGFLAGRFKKITYFSHGAHVFVASFASLSYLVTFGDFHGGLSLILLFLIATVAVVIPCCSSDIIMPLSFIAGLHGHEHEDEHTHHGDDHDHCCH